MRDENTTELENLVLYLQEDGTYAMKIVSYQYTEQDRLDQTNGLPVDLTDKVSYQSINDEGVITSIFSLEVTCLTILISSCEYGNSEHWGGYDGVNKCPGYQENEFAQLGDCGSGGGGGGGFDSGADPSTSDSSGTTNIQTWNTQGGGSGIGTSPIEPPVEPSTEEKIEMCFG